MGQSIAFPFGVRRCTITGRAMQNTDPTFASGVLQYQLNCGAANTPNYLPIGNYGVSLPQGVWTKITGTIDFTATAGCDQSTTGGVVGVVNSYLKQAGAESLLGIPDSLMADM